MTRSTNQTIRAYYDRASRRAEALLDMLPVDAARKAFLSEYPTMAVVRAGRFGGRMTKPRRVEASRDLAVDFFNQFLPSEAEQEAAALRADIAYAEGSQS